MKMSEKRMAAKKEPQLYAKRMRFVRHFLMIQS